MATCSARNQYKTKGVTEFLLAEKYKHLKFQRGLYNDVESLLQN
jgi:hypothetical protein